jgi:RNA polymerase sigma-70 factor (ECF subfamily)
MEINDQLTEKAKYDLVLIDRAINHKDQQAYAELLKRYRDVIYFLMLRMSANHYDAEDLTIEAFGKAFKNLRQYTADYAFSTWLYRIATNNCIDFLRRNNRIPSADKYKWKPEDQDELIEQLPSEILDPEEDLMHKQKIKLMREVVDKLKPHYRNLITLRYFDELSYEEITEILHLPLGTVKAQLFRARALLLHIIESSRDSI